MNDFNLLLKFSASYRDSTQLSWCSRSAKEEHYFLHLFCTAMAPVLSKLVSKSPSFLSSILGKPIAVTGGGLALLLWLASVHRTNQNRR
jgi:hypothetical protein